MGNKGMWDWGRADGSKDPRDIEEERQKKGPGTTCDCCGGTGVVREDLDDDGDIVSEETCRACGGSGVVYD